MKKLARIYTLVLTFALALLSLTGCAERNRADQNADADFSKKGDVLVVYFTWSGHLRSMAHWIADEVGADYARILRKEEYPIGYNETALSVRGSKVKDSEAVVREWVKALSK